MTVTTTEPTVTVSYERQAAIIDPRKASETHVTICGLGTVGSNAAVELARLGICKFHLIDFDVIEPHNMPSQRYGISDLGRTKAEALAEQIAAVNDKASLTFYEQPLVGGEIFPDGPVILAVDNMDVRKAILDLSLAYHPEYPLVMDFRMGGNNLQVFSFNPSEHNDLKKYGGYHFPQSEAEPVPCGGRTVSYVGALSGALAANYVRKHINGDKVPFLTAMSMDTMFLQTLG
jgi:molybdopterin/thiamine biosynthesis adenylyltransferase